jgi:glutaredoxin 3
MEVKALFKRIGVQPHVIELDHLGSSSFQLHSCPSFQGKELN